jgi:hypothetical protein
LFPCGTCNTIEPPIFYGTYDPSLIIPEVCAGDKDGAFTIEAAGGTAPTKFSLDAINGIHKVQ